MHLAKAINTQIMKSELVKSWGTTVTTSSFKKMMNEILAPFGARAFIKRVSMKSLMKLKIGGCYWSTYRGAKIVVSYHMAHRRKKVFLSTRVINRIIFLTSQTLQHELIHQAQEKRLGAEFYVKRIPVVFSKRIQKKRKDDVVYYSMKEEVDCYGQNIAMELVYRYPNESPRNLLKAIDKRKSQSFRAYKKTFDGTDWTDLRKALLKKVWKWLPLVTAPPRLAS